MTFGETLRGLRKKKGQTQHDVAAALGISLRAYVSYEKDERRPRSRPISMWTPRHSQPPTSPSSVPQKSRRSQTASGAIMR